jgi:protein phosphatase
VRQRAIDAIVVVSMRACGLTSPGLVRGNNEDAFLCDDARRLFVVADGMGGHAAGEVASRLAIESIVAFFAGPETTELGRPAGGTITSAEAERLRQAISVANARVFHAAQEDPAWAGMGTTVVAARLADSEDRVVIAHVGDSRLYVFADGELTLLTRDDSWAELAWSRQLEGVPISPAGLPNRNVLTSVLGVRPEVTVHVEERTLPRPGLLLLCSDGLHAYVPHADIENILLEAGSSPEDGVRALVAAALARGGPDNVTAVAVAYGMETPAEASS